MTNYNIHKTIFLFLGWLVFNGCTKEIDLDLEKKPRRIVIEGNVYNTPGPYYIRVTLSNPALSNKNGDGGIDYAEPVKNALVTISDNAGAIDTLIPSPDSVRKFVKFYRDRVTIDSLFREDANYFSGERGFYQTTKLKGEPGRTYTLKVIHNQQEYSATAFMPPVTVLDSVQIRTKPFFKDNAIYKVPVMFFNEPQNTTDYYWTFTISPSVNDPNITVPLLFSTREILPYSIFNDRFLLPYVNGIYSDFTYSKNSSAFDVLYYYGFVHLGSLTEQHYNFLKTIIDQLQSDGGTYKPTPSTPPTNISNNGLGFFGASAVSRVFTFSPDFQ